MLEYITKGTITTKTISAREIEAGTLCVIEIDSKYYCVTINHIDKEGDWVVDGDYRGTVSKETTLFWFSALTNDNVFPIAISNWKTIITGNMVGLSNQTFLIKPKTFRPGKNVMTCSECHCTFLASKSQPYCKNCCAKLSVAYLHQETAQKVKQHMFNRTAVETIAVDAYTHGRVKTSTPNFYEWLKQTLDKWL